jgi:hypothetical protein
MASKTDAVCLALTAMWTTALTGVQVADGPQVNSDPSIDWLFVGFNGDVPDEYNEGAIAQQSLMAFAKTKQEDGQVTCSVVSTSGDTDIPATRARAYGLVAAAEAALRADMTLGGLVMHSFVSDHRYSPVQTTKGAKVRVVFTVTYQAQL